MARNYSRREAAAAGLALAGSIALAGCTGSQAKNGSEQNSMQETTTSGELLEKLDFDTDAQPEPVKQVVFLSGSWHDMGVQFAQQANYALKRYVSEGIGSNISTWGWDRSRELLQSYLDHYDEVAPQLVELFKGMAEGLDISYEDLALGWTAFYEEPEEEEESQRVADTCSSVAVWGSQTDGGILISGADWDSNGATCYFMPAIVAYPDDANAFISESGFEGNVVMNNKGLVCTGSSGQNAEEGDTGMGIPVMCSSWLVATNCETAAEAEKAFLPNLWTTYGENQNYNDTQGGHIVVESTHSHNDSRVPGDFDEVDYLITTNDFMCSEMLSSVLPEGSGYDDCRPRYWTEEKILLDAQGKVTKRTVADALGSTAWYDGQNWTEDNWNIDTGLNSPEAVSPYYQNVMKAIAVPEQSAYYVMNGCSNREVSLLPNASGVYVQLQLLSSPAEVAAAARNTANSLLYSAGSHIAHTDGDTTELEELLNEAKEALVEGDALTAKALLNDGDEALALYAQATSAYLRAQAAGQQAAEDMQAVLDL